MKCPSSVLSELPGFFSPCYLAHQMVIAYLHIYTQHKNRSSTGSRDMSILFIHCNPSMRTILDVKEAFSKHCQENEYHLFTSPCAWGIRNISIIPTCCICKIYVLLLQTPHSLSVYFMGDFYFTLVSWKSLQIQSPNIKRYLGKQDFF